MTLMNQLVKLPHRIVRRLDRARLGLDVKSYSERAYWKDDLPRYMAWYTGELKELYGYPSPAENQKIQTGQLLESALLTLNKISTANDRRYFDALDLERHSLNGKSVLDIGCGPNGAALVFEGADIIGLDPLVDVYRELGFPIDQYGKNMRYLKCSAEKIDLSSHSMDAVISVNAIDHVDDFDACAREIKRVLKPGGMVRFEVHYHEARVCEPQELSDERMMACYGDIGIRKIKTRQFGEEIRYTKELDGEYVVTWGN